MGTCKVKDQITLFDVLEQTAPEQSAEAGPGEGTGQAADVETRDVAASKEAGKKRAVKAVGPQRTKLKPAREKAASAPVPAGDVRLTANIRQDIHLKLKIVAATRRTTIGDLLEELVEKYL